MYGVITEDEDTVSIVTRPEILSTFYAIAAFK